jgi:hypothetical protein
MASLIVTMIARSGRRATTERCDLTASDNLQRFGISYVLGAYNVMNSRYLYPSPPRT